MYTWLDLRKIVAANLLHRILLFSTSDKMSHLQYFIKDFPLPKQESTVLV